MGISRGKQTYAIDGAVIDTGSSTLSTIGQILVKGAQAASAIPKKPEYGTNSRNVGGIGAQVQTIGNLKFSFIFGRKLYTLDLYILPDSTPELICHKDMDEMGLNYQTMHKSVTRISDAYSEKVSMRGGLPFRNVSHQSYFTEAQLRSMHRNLGHPSV